jgi:hypothetical protein
MPMKMLEWRYLQQKKIAELSQGKRMESDTQTDDDRGCMNNSTETDSMVNDGDIVRPPKKPPRQTSTSCRGWRGSKQEKEIMKILFWNIRGMEAMGRRNQLRELCHKYRVDAICL